MKDVRKAMTETELVKELHRLEIVRDELVGRQLNYRRMANDHQYGVQ